ncbi:hypothetical protein PV08_00453 [Exophiala spinifera]|uniref:Uncharacterized protein n=1 Tax=Exophiala spinifera TaxID=91928 RepID=A0A0D2BLR0_9EURO|nr:uncharacterized protein PV08_00453 [Exophiala spinifera]KIW19878.1 hypothetical protein PV08_00453 [Exophiala spinifera]
MDVSHALQFNAALHKRKRGTDDTSDQSLTRSPKRRPTKCLPIRLSPPTRSQPQSRAYSTFTSIYQQPPTPVDTSEDESPSEPNDDSHWPSRSRTALRESQGSDSSTSSMQAQYGESDAMDMDVNPPTIRRARSNDIIPPPRDSNFLSTMDRFARERVPTPISSHFDNRVADLPSVPRHQFPPLRTNLSPMIEQDSWIGKDGLPSPVEDHDPDSMMVDQSNGGVGGGESPTAAARWEDSFGLQFDGAPSPGKARSARLHMGFLSGCDKCIQKVPGHYSHILWS